MLFDGCGDCDDNNERFHITLVKTDMAATSVGVEHAHGEASFLTAFGDTVAHDNLVFLVTPVVVETSYKTGNSQTPNRLINETVNINTHLL